MKVMPMIITNEFQGGWTSGNSDPKSCMEAAFSAHLLCLFPLEITARRREQTTHHNQTMKEAKKANLISESHQ